MPVIPAVQTRHRQSPDPHSRSCNRQVISKHIASHKETYTLKLKQMCHSYPCQAQYVQNGCSIVLDHPMKIFSNQYESGPDNDMVR